MTPSSTLARCVTQSCCGVWGTRALPQERALRGRVQPRGPRPTTSAILTRGLSASSAQRLAYVYKAQKEKTKVRGKTSNVRVIWGKVVRSHGNSGVVKAKFRSNLVSRRYSPHLWRLLWPVHLCRWACLGSATARSFALPPLAVS
jgi:large subunit ribosomal protein L35Ae